MDMLGQQLPEAAGRWGAAFAVKRRQAPPAALRVPSKARGETWGVRASVRGTVEAQTPPALPDTFCRKEMLSGECKRGLYRLTFSFY